MTVQLYLSPKSKRDIEAIWEYTNERWGVAQADQYIDIVRNALSGTAENPALGQSRDEIHPGYFKIPSGSHMIFYRRSGVGIRILRICISAAILPAISDHTAPSCFSALISADE